MQFMRNLLRLPGRSGSSLEPNALSETLGCDSQSRMEVGWSTDVGEVRAHNEDAAVAITAAYEADGATQTVGVFVLADGMAGHLAGEVASSLAARTVAHHIGATVLPASSCLR